MKIICLLGSPRKSGNSATVAARLMARAGLLLAAHCSPFVGMADTEVLFAEPHVASTGVVGVVLPAALATTALAGLTTTVAELIVL